MSSTRSSSPFVKTAITADQVDRLAARVESTGSAMLDVTAPATTEEIGSVPDCDESDVDTAVAAAHEAQIDWAATPVDRRAAVIDRFSDLVVENRAELLDLIQLETGKSRQTAVEGLFSVPSACEQAVSRGPEAVADEPRGGGIPLLTTATVSYEPVGVVGVISPWNYPVTLSMADVIPALVAGNSVVLKPDEKTPYATLFFGRVTGARGPAGRCTAGRHWRGRGCRPGADRSGRLHRVHWRHRNRTDGRRARRTEPDRLFARTRRQKPVGCPRRRRRERGRPRGGHRLLFERRPALSVGRADSRPRVSLRLLF